MQNQYINSYQKQDVEGASKGKIVLLLFDGALRFLRLASKAIDEKNIEEAHNNIIRAENIIYELMSTLNVDVGELSQNLLRLYDFMIWQMVEANRDKDKKKIDDVIKLITPLRDAWKVIVEKETASKIIPISKDSKGKEEKVSINLAG